jgi:hypothetical protein
MSSKKWLWKETAEIIGVLGVIGSLIVVALDFGLGSLTVNVSPSLDVRVAVLRPMLLKKSPLWEAAERVEIAMSCYRRHGDDGGASEGIGDAVLRFRS